MYLKKSLFLLKFFILLLIVGFCFSTTQVILAKNIPIQPEKDGFGTIDPSISRMRLGGDESSLRSVLDIHDSSERGCQQRCNLKGEGNRVFYYKPKTVTLTGIIRLKTLPGPPNYESIEKGDNIETFAYLILDNPIDVIDQNGDKNSKFGETEKNVTILQIGFSENSNWSLAFVGKHTNITGTLDHQSMGPEYTRVSIFANHFAKAPIPVLHYAPEIVTLSGTIKVEKYPAPPVDESIGDTAVTYRYLTLDYPVNIEPQKTDEEKQNYSQENVTEVHLVKGNGNWNWSNKLIGRHVWVTGKLEYNGHVLIHTNHFEIKKISY